MTRFLITGLPRSRTAWLANALTASGRFCLHEPLSGLSRLDQVWALWDRPEVHGISDATFSLFLGKTLDKVRPRTVIISRPLEEVFDSLERIGLAKISFLKLMEERLNPWLRHPLVKTVDFHHLSDLDLLQDVWKHLGIDSFPRKQMEQLVKMRVTVKYPPLPNQNEIDAFSSIMKEAGVDLAAL